MASEAVTRNDLKDILNEVLPPTPSEYKKLLWTNSTSPFGAQTVSLDLSAYEYIEVWFGTLVTTDAMLPNPLEIPLGERREIACCHGLGDGGANENTGVRDVTVSATGVTFGDYNYKNRRTGGGLTTANQFAVPSKIYGVKCERVNPPQVEIADYIVEQGTDGIWTYRKWNSGIAECWGILPTQTLAITQAWGSIYSAGSNTIRGNFPTGLFVSAPVESFAIRGSDSSAVPCFGGNNSATQTSAYQFVRGTASSVSISLSIHAIGRWK